MPCYPALAMLIGSADRDGRPLGTNRDSSGSGDRAVALVIIAAILFLVRGLPSARRHLRRADSAAGYSRGLHALAGTYVGPDAGGVRLLAPASRAGGSGVPDRERRRVALAGREGGVRARGDDGGVLSCGAPGAGAYSIRIWDREPLAEALVESPPGKLIVDDQYYAFSSVFFYANRKALLLNGRVNNLEYGSYAPGAPNVFLKDADFQRLWGTPERLLPGGGGSAASTSCETGRKIGPARGERKRREISFRESVRRPGEKHSARAVGHAFLPIRSFAGPQNILRIDVCNPKPGRCIVVIASGRRLGGNGPDLET